MENTVKLNGLAQGKYVEMLRFELADVMDHFGEESMGRIEELIAELEDLVPVSNEFDVEVSKREFFRKYYKHEHNQCTNQKSNAVDGVAF